MEQLKKAGSKEIANVHVPNAYNSKPKTEESQVKSDKVQAQRRHERTRTKSATVSGERPEAERDDQEGPRDQQGPRTVRGSNARKKKQDGGVQLPSKLQHHKKASKVRNSEAARNSDLTEEPCRENPQQKVYGPLKTTKITSGESSTEDA